MMAAPSPHGSALSPGIPWQQLKDFHGVTDSKGKDLAVSYKDKTAERSFVAIRSAMSWTEEERREMSEAHKAHEGWETAF